MAKGIKDGLLVFIPLMTGGGLIIFALDLVLETVMVCAMIITVSFASGLLVALLSGWLRVSHKRAEGIISLLIVAVALYIAVPHTYMTIKLAPIKREFHRIAFVAPRQSYTKGEIDGRPVIGLDYGGALTEVIKKRDQVTKCHGFNVLIPWHTGSGGTRTASVYIWTGRRN